MGANIDDAINDGTAPYVSKINGLVYHRIGSLLPRENEHPKFARLYIYDTEREVSNRITALTCDKLLDVDIINSLMHMLDEHNPLVQQFRMARDLLAQHGNQRIGIRIVGAEREDPLQFNLPTSNEIVGLIVGDFSLGNYKRDIIVDSIPSGLQHISCLHPAYMALQYPLLFPYGERGFQLGIPYRYEFSSSSGARNKVTMQEFYCYRCHY
jgi:hypothetical protein